MQDEVNEKTIALYIKTGKPTLFLFCKDRASSLPAPDRNTVGNGMTA